ncbi:hypothetical protein M409DRAFT_22310 [Zasmidium cellare ATCC 36951]|uniref:Tryptophan synthase beta chain-like PALP domain-containing protein n=1 Tax=Zasmidium cellare ATCC 36951 TaxID=1080233 RepID=A0A6A6CNK7_ZASCE|nr:uncharacterized protein M409DRAFT_22310 [Zasmidium cellare ATCC 36951]KAF2167502.1 hypothetical protein M409DRAFT_22310 [Zasmidium cellare ATCC 36951]
MALSLTNSLSGMYIREVAAAGSSYGIATNVLVPPSTLLTVIQGLQADGMVVTVIEEKLHPDLDPVTAAIAKIGAHCFPSHNEANAISGQGTIALELENEVAQLLAMKPSPPKRNMPGLHAIISIVGTASALCGICMACERTGTRVFGAETVPDPILDTHGPNLSSIVRGEERYDFDVPMGDLPFSTFTARGLLSAILYAEQSTAIRASEALLQQCSVHVTPRDVAPLAVGLYSEDFHRFVRKNVDRGQVVNIGIIVQADQARLGTQRPGTVEFFPGEDLHDGLESLFLC